MTRVLVSSDRDRAPTAAAPPPRPRARWPTLQKPELPRCTGPAQATQNLRRRSRLMCCSPLDHATGLVKRADSEEVDPLVDCLTAILLIMHTGRHGGDSIRGRG
jgi:hypothetical protein